MKAICRMWGSKADRLELRSANIWKFRTDITMLIDNNLVRQERMRRFIADTVAPTLPEKIRKDDACLKFINKVRQLLEQNLAEESYTVDALSEDMGMSRTAFYNKMKKMTGQAPADYMLTFKMEEQRDYWPLKITLSEKLQRCWAFVTVGILQKGLRKRVVYVRQSISKP